MTSVRLPQLGSVVWAEVADPNGFRKVRPAVVVTATDNITVAGRLLLVAITTRLDSPLPDDHFLLPWDPQGKARSGLRRRCAAVASWQMEVAIDDVKDVVGILPPATITGLLVKVAAHSPPPKAFPDESKEK